MPLSGDFRTSGVLASPKSPCDRKNRHLSYFEICSFYFGSEAYSSWRISVGSEQIDLRVLGICPASISWRSDTRALAGFQLRLVLQVGQMDLWSLTPLGKCGFLQMVGCWGACGYKSPKGWFLRLVSWAWPCLSMFSIYPPPGPLKGRNQKLYSKFIIYNLGASSLLFT